MEGGRAVSAETVSSKRKHHTQRGNIYENYAGWLKQQNNTVTNNRREQEMERVVERHATWQQQATTSEKEGLYRLCYKTQHPVHAYKRTSEQQSVVQMET